MIPNLHDSTSSLASGDTFLPDAETTTTTAIDNATSTRTSSVMNNLSGSFSRLDTTTDMATAAATTSSSNTNSGPLHVTSSMQQQEQPEQHHHQLRPHDNITPILPLLASVLHRATTAIKGNDPSTCSALLESGEHVSTTAASNAVSHSMGSTTSSNSTMLQQSNTTTNTAATAATTTATRNTPERTPIRRTNSKRASPNKNLKSASTHGRGGVKGGSPAAAAAASGGGGGIPRRSVSTHGRSGLSGLGGGAAAAGMLSKSASTHGRTPPRRTVSATGPDGIGLYHKSLSTSMHNSGKRGASSPGTKQGTVRAVRSNSGQNSLHASLHHTPMRAWNNDSEESQPSQQFQLDAAAEFYILRKQMNEMSVKHRESLYWLKLELDTVRQEKEAVEDRMAELYRDLQEMEEESHHEKSKQQQQQQQQLPASAVMETSGTSLSFHESMEDISPNGSSSTQQQQQQAQSKPQHHHLNQLNVQLDPYHVMMIQKQVEKQEKMIRVLNNQMTLIRTSSENVIRSLKEEISDLMDEKCRVEMDLMNQMVDLEKEKKALATKLDETTKRADNAEQKLQEQQEKQQQQQQQQQQSSSLSLTAADAASTETNGSTSNNQALVQQQQEHKPEKHQKEQEEQQQHHVKEVEHELDNYKAEVKRLTEEKNKVVTELAEERKASQAMVNKLVDEKQDLSKQIEKLQGEISVLRSSTDAVQALDQMRLDREEMLATLDRVALLWDRADESIQELEHIMMELKPRDHVGSGGNSDDSRSMSLSTLETASLVHGQVKVSLMLIELKLRNHLACLKNDKSQMRDYAPDDKEMQRFVDIARDEAMAAINAVGQILREQSEKLEGQYLNETRKVKDKLESKMEDLRRMESRQKLLEEEITRLRAGESKNHSDPTAASGALSSATTSGFDSDKSTLHNNGGHHVDNNISSSLMDHNPHNNGDLFVSSLVLQRLQNEVLQVVERIKEKNETIGRLTAAAEEHKVRERSLMDELRRLMKDRAGIMHRGGGKQQHKQQRLSLDRGLNNMSGDHSNSCYEEGSEGVEETVYDEIEEYTVDEGVSYFDEIVEGDDDGEEYEEVYEEEIYEEEVVETDDDDDGGEDEEGADSSSDYDPSSYPT